MACRGAGPQESVSRKAHRSGARLRGRSAASVRMHRRAPARGLPPAAPRLPGAACCWALAVWSLCALCSLWSLSAAAAAAAAAQANNHREHREHREHRAERRRAKGGAAAGRTASAVHGGRCGRSWRMLPGACVTGRAPIRCVDSRLGRRLWPQAMRWIRVSSAANSRPRRHRFRSRTATRGIACPGCCLLPGSRRLVSVSSVQSVVPFCCYIRRRATTEDTGSTGEGKRRAAKAPPAAAVRGGRRGLPRRRLLGSQPA